jgi:transposase InsO family protein
MAHHHHRGPVRGSPPGPGAPRLHHRPAAVDIRWCGDIAYINSWQGWLYLATVIDLASRRVVGWAVADHLRTDLVDAALSDAIRRRRPAPGLIFHSEFAGG